MLLKDSLFNILYKESFKYSPDKPYQLSSGNTSPLYFDCKSALLSPTGLLCIGLIMRNIILSTFQDKIISSISYDIDTEKELACIGGMTMGADPIVYATCMCIDLNPIIVRKEEKGHGTRKYLEGNYNKGNKAIVVHDVITTGGSTIKAINRMRDAGLIVDTCIVLIDREEFNGKQNIEDLDVKVISIYKASDFTKL